MNIKENERWEMQEMKREEKKERRKEETLATGEGRVTI